MSGQNKSQPRQRKPQSEEEYLAQKKQFQEEGPRINTSEWLYNEEVLSNLDNSKKTDRTHMLHACERAYYMRDYNKCLELIEKAEKLFGVGLEDEEDNDQLKKDFSSAGKKTKKSLKVERHVVELFHIKESCLAKKLAQTNLQEH